MRALLSLLLLGACAGPAVSTTAPASAAVVIGRSITIASKILGERRLINIYTPPGYHEGQARYPVLYMPDGGIAEDFHHITGIVQVCVGNGSMRPMIVVGIENTERRGDLTGPTRFAEDRAIAPRVGGSAAFRRFLREELMPVVARELRVSEERAIVGESLAGLFVLETFLREPDLFDTYIAVDPSLWWDGRALELGAAAALASFGARRKGLFIATADVKETQDSAAALAAVLRQAALPGLRWAVEAMPGETHATIFHAAALRAFRTMLAPAQVSRPRP